MTGTLPYLGDVSGTGPEEKTKIQGHRQAPVAVADRLESCKCEVGTSIRLQSTEQVRLEQEKGKRVKEKALCSMCSCPTKWWSWWPSEEQLQLGQQI